MALMWDFSYCGIHNPQCVVKVGVIPFMKFSISIYSNCIVSSL